MLDGNAFMRDRQCVHSGSANKKISGNRKRDGSYQYILNEI
jgi:hypothetical protein